MAAPPKQALKLPSELRLELKNPLGKLLTGTPGQAMKKLKEFIDKKNPTCVISVGDVVSQNMLKHGVKPQVIIVDHRVMREEIQQSEPFGFRTFRVENPAGVLAPESWTVVKRALRHKQPAEILVEGEEDMLTLVAVLEAPDGALVVYGQPHEGVVAVIVDDATRERVRRIVVAMEPVPKS